MNDSKTINLISMLMYLQDLGVSIIEARYAGGGDDGSIEEITLQDASGNEIEDSIENREQIESICYKLLERECGDWVNNEGGYGTITIEVPSGEYSVDGYLRVVDDVSDGGSGDLRDVYDCNTEED